MTSPPILTINAGSSSIKFALFSPTATPAPIRLLTGQIDRIAQPTSTFTATIANQPATQIPISAPTHQQAAHHLIDFITTHAPAPAAVGHRVVHGGLHLLDHQLITPTLLDQLRAAQPLDLAHLPLEISLIESFQARFPALPQVACFDTAFFRDLPTVARLLPIPRRFTTAGVRRFGFHGLSYTYLLDQLHHLAGPAAASGRVILAHLGSGASMAALLHAKPIDTTMSFTPTAGLVMATRPGDLDPALLTYLMRTENLTPDQMDDVLTNDCGLKGISETSPDLRDLQSRRQSDPRADEALNLFAYQAKKYIGAFAAALGGLDTLVFSGGIGQHSPQTRQEICQNLHYLNLHLDPHENGNNAPIISTKESQVIVRVIPTDEELVIARTTLTLIQ